MAVVDKANYTLNSLRKNRTQAFQSDIQQVFSTYSHSLKAILADEMTVAIFSDIWSTHNMHFIFQCLCEEESEDEFAQLMYDIVLKKYFIFKDKNSKIFAIFALYFLHYACENRKRINICTSYINELKTFVLENRNDKNCHYVKIAYQLHQKCFNLCTKVGLRNPIVKGNGEVFRKPPIVKIDSLHCTNKIQQQLKQRKQIKSQNKSTLKDTINSYEKLKNQLFKDASVNKQKFPLDIYFCSRVQKMIRNYKEFVNNNEKAKKKEEDEQ